MNYTFLKNDRVNNLYGKIQVLENGRIHISELEKRAQTYLEKLQRVETYLEKLQRVSRIVDSRYPAWEEIQFLHNAKRITISRT